jgi:OOP family OmpA-OmpF porin
MNPHVLQGTVAFIIWSIFASWYYVTQIKEWPEPSTMVDQTVPKEKSEIPVITTPSDSIVEVIEKPKIIPVDYTAVVLFELNQSSPSADVKLKEISDSISHLQEDVTYLLKITGHTCDLGSKSYNDSLGWNRAKSISEILVQSIKENIKIEIFSKGENEPIVANSTEESRAKNRRVEIQLTN